MRKKQHFKTAKPQTRMQTIPGLHQLTKCYRFLCNPLTVSLAFPFYRPLSAGFPLQIGLYNQEKVLGRPGRSGEGSPEARPRPPAVVL